MEGELLNSILLDSIFPQGTDKIEIFNDKILVVGIEHYSFADQSVQNIVLDTNLVVQEKENFSTTFNKAIYNNGNTSIGENLFTFGYIFASGKRSEAHIQKIGPDLTLIDEFRYTKGLVINDCNALQATSDGNLLFLNKYADGIGATGEAGTQVMIIDPYGIKVDSLNMNGIISSGRVILPSSIGDIYCFTKRNPIDQYKESHGHISKYEKHLDTMYWSTGLPFNNFTNGRRYAAQDMLEAQNGDILVAGSVWDAGPDGANNGNDQTDNGFITRLDVNGNIKWLRIYKLSNEHPKLPQSEFGEYRSSSLRKLYELDDGRILTSGTAFHPTKQNVEITDLGDPNYSVWLMTVNADGCLDGEECDEVIILDGEYRPKDGYLPILNSDQNWVYRHSTGLSSGTPFQYTFSEDSVSQLTNYYFERIQTYQEDGSSTFVQGYYREIDGMIYKKLEGNYNEELILDMSLIKGDSITLFQGNISNLQTLIATEVDTIAYNDGVPRKRIELKCADETNNDISWFWVEGIGELFSSDYCLGESGFEFWINCVSTHDGDLIFNIVNEENCWLITSIEDVEFSPFKVSPNPAQDLIRIDSEYGIIEQGVIVNIFGQVVLSFSEDVVDISDIKAGVYFIKILDRQNRLHSLKLMKSNQG